MKKSTFPDKVILSMISGLCMACSSPLANAAAGAASIYNTATPPDTTTVTDVQNTTTVSNLSSFMTTMTSIYNNGACIPVPTCSSSMQPNISVVPYVVYGVYDQPNCGTPQGHNCTGGSGNCTYQADVAIASPHCTWTVSPVTSYYAYVYGGASGTGSPQDCYDASTAACNFAAAPAGQKYWRACLNVTVQAFDSSGNPGSFSVPSQIISSGATSDIQTIWGILLGSITVTTNCVPTAQFQGSSYGTWSK